MAGHLPIRATSEHNAIIKKAFALNIQNQKPFDRIKTNNGYFQLLTSEYQMNDEHGKVDDLIFSFVPLNNQEIYEYHFDINKKLNEIYLVM